MLGQAQVGKAITVSASYTDGYASAESAASSATAAVTAAKVITGTPGGDTFTASASHNILDGGTGIDTVIFSNSAAAYTPSAGAPGGSASDYSVSGPGGADRLVNIERLTFADANLAFDLDGNAGQTYRLYQAAFNRTPDLGGLGGWIAGRDDGLTQLQVANSFMASDEFKSLYGVNPDNAQFVSLHYTNALHRPADTDSLDYWVNQLASGVQTRA